MKTVEPFGKLLKDKRIKRGLTQDDLAELADNICTGSYISYLERKLNSPAIEIVDKLAEVLNIPRKRARDSAGYADSDYTETSEGILLDELSFMLDSFSRLNVHYKAVAKTIVSGVLQNLYELQTGTVDSFQIEELQLPAVKSIKIPHIFAASEPEIQREKAKLEVEKKN